MASILSAARKQQKLMALDAAANTSQRSRLVSPFGHVSNVGVWSNCRLGFMCFGGYHGFGLHLQRPTCRRRYPPSTNDRWDSLRYVSVLVVTEERFRIEAEPIERHLLELLPE